MEIASVGNHVLGVCPHCDLLFDAPRSELRLEISAIQAMYLAHLDASLDCKAKNDAMPSFDELAAQLRPGFEKAAKERDARIDGHPCNGRLGYWLVAGIRHEARTRASSAAEAIEKCGGVVQEWESPEAEFIGEELPDVF